jgi:GT2 family glycosyltransferase
VRFRYRLRDYLLAPGRRRWLLLSTLLVVRARLRHAIALYRIRLQQRSLQVDVGHDMSTPDTGALKFATVDYPRVSIVIPAFNHVATTLRCLAAVSASTPSSLFEVVVVDDCSTDSTAQRVPSIEGLRYLRNSTNLGFCRTAHRGATAARGRHLVFLNNDTLVQPGWLEALLETVEADASIGAVGSKLVYPDGVLQEAGGVVWNDGTAGNIGRGGNPNAPEFRYRRDVDYCSAASLLVRKDLYDLAGGFDMRFAPGYYEDTDLCFTLRSLGKRVVYEPRSVVVHLEGVTHGTDFRPSLTGGSKANQYRNRHLFTEKWSMVLAEHDPPSACRLPRRGTRRQGPRVLVCDTRVPAPDRDSGSLRMHWILRLFTELGCSVTFFPLDRSRRGNYGAALERMGVELHNSASSLRSFARTRGNIYDVVFLSRPQVAAAAMATMRQYMPKARVLYDTVDLSWVRRERQQALRTGQAPSRLDGAAIREIELMRCSDVVSTVTPEEAEIVQSMASGVLTVVLPNVHAIEPTKPPPFDGRRGLLFIGSFRHQPNVDAAIHLIKDILPLIRAALDVEVTIVGAEPPAALQALARDGVRVTGHVSDVHPLFDSARVFVSPLRFGAGMKGKNGHAMALGLPMVTTPIGAEGMSLVDGQHALIRDTPAAFAAAVVELYSTPELWSTLSVEGRELVSELWSPAAMIERLSALVRC